MAGGPGRARQARGRAGGAKPGDQAKASRSPLGPGREGVRVRHRGRQEDPCRALRRALTAARLQHHVRPRLHQRRLPGVHQPRRRARRLARPPEPPRRDADLLLAGADRAADRLQAADGLAVPLRLYLQQRLRLRLRPCADRGAGGGGSRDPAAAREPGRMARGVVRADRSGAQGRAARGSELDRLRARERDRLPHLHGDGARSVRPAVFQLPARANAEAPTARAAGLAEGRVPGLTPIGTLRDLVLSIGADPRDTAEVRFRKRLLVGVSLIILPFAFIWGCLYWAVGEQEVALTPWAYAIGSAISLAVFARTRRFALLRTAQQLLILVAPAAGTVMLGGIDESSSVILWSLFAPLGAVAFDRPRRAWPWFAAFVGAIVLSLALSEVVRPNGADLPDAFVRTFDVLNIVVVSLVALLLLVTFARGRETAQARVEALLLNVLPADIAQRLQSDPNSIADHFDEASILFADVVDFTPLSSRLDAREVVDLLDRLFTSFDELVDRYDVEKIKTIGDCYMAAAGVPRKRLDHAHALAALALEMRGCARTCLPGSDLRLRIGISSGPVVAGGGGGRGLPPRLYG